MKAQTDPFNFTSPLARYRQESAQTTSSEFWMPSTERRVRPLSVGVAPACRFMNHVTPPRRPGGEIPSVQDEISPITPSSARARVIVVRCGLEAQVALTLIEHCECRYINGFWNPFLMNLEESLLSLPTRKRAGTHVLATSGITVPIRRCGLP